MEMVVDVKHMRMRCKHVDDVSLHTYIHTYIHTYVYKYSDFLVAMISAGLAQARPNKEGGIVSYSALYSCCTGARSIKFTTCGVIVGSRIIVARNARVTQLEVV